MRVAVVGGGPGGLYFSILLKQYLPEASVEIFERNGLNDTFGFGVVFSDASLSRIAKDDPETYHAITANFAHWDDIDVYAFGEMRRSSGHGFSGLSRQRLLSVLQERCAEVGVIVHHNAEVTDLDALRSEVDLVVGADGLNSVVREKFKDIFKPDISWGKARFTWMGTTRQFPAFTFYFKENEHGLWRVHAYNYEDGRSTFIIETTEDSWRASGLSEASEEESARYCETLFAEELEGHPLLINRSIWRRFPVVSAQKWWTSGVALLGDAVHTAHFSIGSGTKLALEDAAVLAQSIRDHAHDLNGSQGALAEYEAIRKPQVTSLQRAAKVSQSWFEETELYFKNQGIEDFTFSLLTRSLRITHSDLKLRDPAYISTVNEWFSERVHTQLNLPKPPVAPPPMFMPLQVRGMALPNRVALSPMCQYMAQDGVPNDWHFAHYSARAIGGCGLILTEMTTVSPEARITPGCAGLYTDEQSTAWKRIVTFTHEHSAAKIGIQLGHAGRKGSTQLMWEGMDRPLRDGNWPLYSASDDPYYPESQHPQAMNRQTMDEVIDQFVQSTYRAQEANFDLIELHCAHGYLLASFLSPLTNLRTDEYGGDVDARLRFPLEVFNAMRAAWPSDRPMSVRLSSTDWQESGLSQDDFIIIARAFKDAGCDLLNTSTGQTTPDARPEYGRLFQVPYSERARLELSMPTMVAGGISSYADVNSILLAGRADLCLIGRAQLFDPFWVRHAAFDQDYTLGWPNPYGVVGPPYIPKMEWTNRGKVKD